MRDLPLGREFSPLQINVPVMLEPLEKHEGNVRVLEPAVLTRCFSGKVGRGEDTGGTQHRDETASRCKLLTTTMDLRVLEALE